MKGHGLWDNGGGQMVAIITAVEAQQKDPERVNVYVDGAFGFGASRMLAYAHGLAPGVQLSREQIDELQRDDRVERSYAAALNFLSFRPRSRGEIEEYFRKKKTDEDVVEAVVQRLERLGLLDDREFARFWVENRMAFRPRGTRALRLEMRQKGLEREVIDEALAEMGDETAVAYEAGMKKMRAYAGLEEGEFFRKMVGFLQRRGFPYEAAAEAARKLYGEATGLSPSQSID